LYLRKNDKRKAAEQLADLLKHHPDWPDKEKVRNTVRLWSQ
jgi:pterin-4a-carbinolamine dehydratase